MRIFRFIKNFYTDDKDIAVGFSVITWILLGSFHALWISGDQIPGIIIGIILNFLFLIVLSSTALIIDIFTNTQFWIYIEQCWRDSKIDKGKSK